MVDTAGEQGADIETDAFVVGDGKTVVVDGTEKIDFSGDDSLGGVNMDTEEAAFGNIVAVDAECGKER